MTHRRRQFDVSQAQCGATHHSNCSNDRSAQNIYITKMKSAKKTVKISLDLAGDCIQQCNVYLFADVCACLVPGAVPSVS